MTTTTRSAQLASRGTAVVLVAIALAACGSTDASAVPSAEAPPLDASSASAAASTSVASPNAASSAQPSGEAAQELTSASAPLPAGRYTRVSFSPPIAFEVEDGWFVGQLADGFFDVQQDRGTPDVIAVQFAHVQGVIGTGSVMTDATSAASAAGAVQDNPDLEVVDVSESRMSGLSGSNVVVENRGAAHAGILKVPVGTLGIDPGRKLWISFFDTADGVIAVMVGGSIEQWEHTLEVAEPVLESVEIG